MFVLNEWKLLKLLPTNAILCKVSCPCAQLIKYYAKKTYVTSALVEDEWSASRLGRFTPGTYWIGGWMGPWTGLDDVKRKILLLPGLELRSLGRPVRSQSQYPLLCITVIWLPRSGVSFDQFDMSVSVACASAAFCGPTGWTTGVSSFLPPAGAPSYQGEPVQWHGATTI
jgi:hypothetical protein